MIVSERDLDTMLRDRNVIRNSIAKDSNYGDGMTTSHFLKVLHFYSTPQSYGTRIQNRIIKECDLEKVKSKEDRGDIKNDNGMYGEIKVSYKDTKDSYNFVQVRPHQKCDFYLFYAIDTDDDYKQYKFIVTSKDIHDVLTMVGATNCHGVSKNKKDISQVELRFTLKQGSDSWDKLVDNYSVADLKCGIQEI